MHLMFIDDDETTLFLTKEYLKKIEYRGESTCLSSAEEGLAYFAASKEGEEPQYLFLDIKMPGMSGFDFLDFYVERSYHLLFKTKIIMLSSSLNSADKTKSLNYAPVVQYMSKPVNLEEINTL